MPEETTRGLGTGGVISPIKLTLGSAAHVGVDQMKGGGARTGGRGNFEGGKKFVGGKGKGGGHVFGQAVGGNGVESAG